MSSPIRRVFSAPEPVDQGAGEPPGCEGSHSADGEREAGLREGDPAHVVEVDDGEREHDPVPERVDDAARLHEPDRSRELRVEPSEIGRQRAHEAL
jgi:hypothetical protein